MNTKDFLQLGVPLGRASRRATDFVAKFILGGSEKSRLHEVHQKRHGKGQSRHVPKSNDSEPLAAGPV
jgi:hypothetical protein